MDLKSCQARKTPVLGSFITIGSYRDFVRQAFYLIQQKVPAYVCFANVHMVVQAHCDPAFRKILNEADLAAPDGKPISIFLRLREGFDQDRVCGMDIFPDLLKEAEASGKSVYFYGTTHQLLETITKKAQKEFPALKIAGYYSPPFRILSPTETSDIIAMINQTNPDLVFVSLGCPKQEKWMAENKHKIRACLFGLGQAFKIYAGEEKRCPKWMREHSLEWVYRLYLEPRRLWKRYLFTNSLFILLAARDLIGVRLRSILKSLKRTYTLNKRSGNFTG